MGCSASSPNEDGGQVNKQKQRRRLSVAPGMYDVKSQDLTVEPSEARTPLQEEAFKKMRCVEMSQKGHVPYGRKKSNQDRAMSKYCLKEDPGLHVWGVMDGHGEEGHFVSEFVKSKLPLALEKLDIRANPQKACIDAVEDVCQQLAQSGIKCGMSGTTCVFSVLVDTTMYCANIGDSRCVFAKLQEDNSFKAEDFSSDQKPDSPGEKERILKSGGRVMPLPGLPPDNCGPMRVWLAHIDTPGLAMSRSIGDSVGHSVGVISIPEVKKFSLEGTKGYILWASDGVYEFLSSEQTSKIIWDNKPNMAKAAEVLVERSTAEWRAEEEDVVDDITCVILNWNMPES